MKVLFVCLGNICRSPLAEALFRHKIGEMSLGNKFQADSCGTADYHIGSQPDPRTVGNAAKNGIILHHTCRQFAERDFVDFDLILAMDRNNFNSIQRIKKASVHSTKVKLMREFDPEGRGEDVPDPYYGSEQQFQEVFEILDRTVDGLISYLTAP
jgi:protein-tyrosine phosphatase